MCTESQTPSTLHRFQMKMELFCSVFKTIPVHTQATQAYTAKLAKRRHCKTLYWEFTRFSKILEHCYYCGNKFYIPSVHRILVCCVHFGRNLRSFRARTPRTVLPYKLYRRLVSSHAICKQIAKSCQQNLLPARQFFPKRHKINIFKKPNKLSIT